MENKAYYTTKDVAEMTGLTTTTIRNYIKQGKLLAIKIPGKRGYRIRIQDLEDFTSFISKIKIYIVLGLAIDEDNFLNFGQIRIGTRIYGVFTNKKDADALKVNLSGNLISRDKYNEYFMVRPYALKDNEIGNLLTNLKEVEDGNEEVSKEC